MIARYTDSLGRVRELLAREGAEGSLLVIDRDAETLCDQRLLAHLGADEPSGNANVVCRLYLAAPRRCRPLAEEDLSAAPPTEEPLSYEGSPPDEEPPPYEEPLPEEMLPPDEETLPRDGGPLRCEGRLYRLRSLPPEGSGARRLRWCRSSQGGGESWTPVSLREVIGELESYEPARSLTESALARNVDPRRVATSVLRGELQRLRSSRVVLNRGLREAVLEAVRERGMTMSEIAIRCGKVKRDRHGRLSGQTSWLARRVGLMPEAGGRTVRWVRSDILATIARRGLGVPPREVELE